MMKKLPRRIKHWAEEAINARDTAFNMMLKEHPQPSEENKLELIGSAPIMAADSRGVKDKNKIAKSLENCLANLKDDIARLAPAEEMDHSVCFLLAYLDAQVFHGYLTELKAQDIMEHISEKHEISEPVT